MENKNIDKPIEMPDEKMFQFNGMELSERELLILLINKLNEMDIKASLREKDLKTVEEEINKKIQEQNILVSKNFRELENGLNNLGNKQQIQDAIIAANDKKNNKLIAWIAIILTIVQLGCSILLGLLRK